MFDIGNEIESIKHRDKRATLDREFPGEGCGNPECENLCAEALQIAKAMRLDPKTMIEDSIRQGIAPQTHCVSPSAEFAPPFFTAPCRFGFVCPNDHLALSESSKDSSSYVFHAKPGSCEKCQACDGITVPADKMQDESYMRSLGFWKQKDGVYRPHPHCNCQWEKSKDLKSKEVRNRLQGMAEELCKYSREVTDKANELLSEAEKLIQKAQKAKNKVDVAILAAKMSALIISIQCVLWSIEKINKAIAELQKALHQFGMGIADFGKEMASLAKAPVDLTLALKQLHYSRLLDYDQQQKNLPNSPEEAIKRGFVKAPDSLNRYHRNKGQLGNEKYYHPVTGQEVIFDKNGRIVTDPENIGTKNYKPDIDSIKGKIEHSIYDVLPYWIWGNSENDTTPFWGRVRGIGK